MKDFFNVDNGFFKMGSIITDMFVLSVLWLIVSLPIFTIGASTTAVYYVATKRVQDKEGYLIKDFFKSFKENFKQATIMWGIIVIMYMQFFVNIRIVNNNIQGGLGIAIMSLTIFVGILITFFSIFVFPIISRFKMDTVSVIKTAMVLSIKHIFTSLLCAILGVLIIIFTIQTILFIFLAMGFYTFLTSYMFMKVFRNYIPNIDDNKLILNKNEFNNKF